MAVRVSVGTEKSKNFLLDCGVGHNFAPRRNPSRPPCIWSAPAIGGRASSVTTIVSGQFQKHSARNFGIAHTACASASRSANGSTSPLAGAVCFVV